MPGYPTLPPIKNYLEIAGNASFYPAMKYSFPSCSKDRIRLCVDSMEEVEKCEDMQVQYD